MKMLIPGTLLLALMFQGIYFLQPRQDDGRVEKLEQRVDRLEEILFNTVRLTVFDAERKLAEAEQRLENSQSLFIKGFITDQQLQQDRYRVERAKQELKLAKSERGGRKISMEIEVMEAKRNLEVASQRLEFTERLAKRGFSSLTDVQNQRERVTLMQKELELANQRLKAVEELSESRNK